MADATESVEQKDTPRKGGVKKKAAMFTMLLLVFEAVVVVGAFSMFSGPRNVDAQPLEPGLETTGEPAFSEVLVFDGRLYNDRLGTAFEYRVKVAVKVRDEDTVWVEEKSVRFQNELHMELDTIWRSADPRHLREVDKRTLSGRIRRMLEQWLERPDFDAEEGQEAVVKDVVVIPSPGIRINR
ncbi:MAG: hypothetical protein MK085_09560 [Phycisphaerales bacterium]|nr:hypothetical protein [Phycisphaerales bacterium]